MKEEEKKAKLHLLPKMSISFCIHFSGFQLLPEKLPCDYLDLKEQTTLTSNQCGRAARGDILLFGSCEVESSWGSRRNWENEAEPTQKDVCGNYRRRNGNIKGFVQWILSLKWKGGSYNILGWQYVDAFKTSLVDTVWNQNPTKDLREWVWEGVWTSVFVSWFSSSLSPS